MEVTKEVWFLRKNDPVIYPKDLENNPDAHGGRGGIMDAAIKKGVITIPLCDSESGYGSCVSVQVTNQEVAERIISDGGVDILSEGYWSYIGSEKLKVLFRNTEELIPLYRNPMFN